MSLIRLLPCLAVCAAFAGEISFGSAGGVVFASIAFGETEGLAKLPAVAEGKGREVRNLRGANATENYFRKSFALESKPRTAVARVFADTGYELFVNGRLVAQLSEWANVRDYDLRTFLDVGGNLVAIRASNRSGHRGLAFELSVDGRQVVVSDGSWRTFSEERWGWMLADFDDGDWVAPQVMDMSAAGDPQWKGHPGDGSAGLVPTLETCPFFAGAIPKGLDSPFYRAKTPEPVDIPKELLDVAGAAYKEHVQRPLPTIHTHAEVLRLTPGTGTAAQEGKTVKLTAPDRWTGPSFVVDLGEETVGYFRMRIRSTEPVAFRTRQAESIAEVLSEPDRREPLHRMLCHEYRLEKGVQEFESRDRMGGRFVRVEFFDCPAPVEVDGFSLRWSLYPVRKTGYFRCDDETVNAAWLAAERTLHLNMQEFYLDAIKRDRMLWVGDTRGEQLANYLLFGDTDLFEFCWRKMADRQFASGAMPSSYGEGLSVIWDFNCWYVIALGEYIDWTGRTEFPVSLVENVKRVTDWMCARCGGDGLISIPENPIRPLWMVVLNSAKGRDTFINALFLDMLRAACKICTAAGNRKAADRYAAHARRIEPEVRRLHAMHPLASHGGNLFSPQMFYYTLEHQAAEGDVARAFRLLKENMVRMLASGLGTLPENMPTEGPTEPVLDEKSSLGSGSLCHGWQSLLTVFILRHIAGINMLEPGWRRIAIRPNPCGLKRFESVVNTPLGPVAVAFDGNGFAIWIPEGMTAEFEHRGRRRLLPSGKHELKEF